MGIRDKIHQHFSEDKLDLEYLLEAVEEVLDAHEDAFQVLEEAKEPAKMEMAEAFCAALPKFVPSEAWGDPKADIRQDMNRLIFNHVGGGYDLQKRINWLTRIQHPQTQISSPRRIVTTLILLESLSTCLNAFSESPAGFIFESFLAGLLGGYQVKGRVGGNLPIEDIMAFTGLKNEQAGVPLSIKLLAPGTAIKGSYTNLVDAMNRFEHGMKYFVAIKEGEGRLKLASFMISRGNLIDMIVEGSPVKAKKLFKWDPDVPKEIRRLDPEKFLRSLSNWKQLYATLQNTQGYTRDKTPLNENREKEINELEKKGLYYLAHYSYDDLLLEKKDAREATQWSIPKFSALEKMGGIVEYTHLGDLDVSAAAIRNTALSYMKDLNTTISVLFQSVKDLSENVNLYFVQPKRARAMKRGDRAIGAAAKAEAAMQEALATERAEREGSVV